MKACLTLMTSMASKTAHAVKNGLKSMQSFQRLMGGMNCRQRSHLNQIRSAGRSDTPFILSIRIFYLNKNTRKFHIALSLWQYWLWSFQGRNTKPDLTQFFTNQFQGLFKMPLSVFILQQKYVYIVYSWLEDLTTNTTLFCVVSYKLSADRNKVLQQCTDKLYCTVVGDIQ